MRQNAAHEEALLYQESVKQDLKTRHDQDLTAAVADAVAESQREAHETIARLQDELSEVHDELSQTKAAWRQKVRQDEKRSEHQAMFEVGLLEQCREENASLTLERDSARSKTLTVPFAKSLNRSYL